MMHRTKIVHGGAWMLTHYISVATRNIRRAPVASAVNLLTLAVGLVCFVTAYAFVTFWGAADQHFRNADDIYILTVTIRNRNDDNSGFGINNATRAPDIAAELLKSDYPAIHKIARAIVIDRETTVAAEGRAERLFGVAVDPEFLEIFDLPFLAGNGASALAAPRSVILTRDGAARLFGADDPLGKSIVIGNAIDATVTGVIDAIPEPSHFGRSANASLPFDLLASRDIYDALRANAGGGPGPPPQARWFQIGTIVYLYLPATGELTAEGLAAQLDDFVARHVPAESLKEQDYRFGIEPLEKLFSGTGDYLDTGLSFPTVLLFLSGLVLGVACVNYANLATARAARRVREVGVRKALGAAPRQIAAQSLLEAAALSVAALVVALAAFVLAQPLVRNLFGAELGPSFFSSLGVWPALGLLAVGVTVAAGAYPAFVLARLHPSTALATAQARLGSPLFSTLLVGGQFAVASFLLIAVTVISLQNMETRRNALASIEDPLVLVENRAQTTKVSAATLRERLETVPQVRGVTEVTVVPWEGLIATRVSDSADPASPQRTVMLRQVGYDFFDVFNVPLLAGRVFEEGRDDLLSTARAQASGAAPAGAGNAAGPPGGSAPSGSGSASSPAANSGSSAARAEVGTPVVVDRDFVTKMGFGTPEEAIGKLVYRGTPPSGRPPPPHHIIGVVENRSFSFFKLPDVFGTAYTLQSGLNYTVARVAATNLERGLDNIDSAWRELAPNVAISRRFLDEVFARAYSQYLRINQMLGALAITAFAICIAGLFGMATFVAGRRRREIGIRKTLGGSTRRMVVLLLTSFSRPVLVANLIAWPAGYLAARAYLNQFSETIDLTVWPFLASLVITLAITCAAVAGQTLRAARTTPAEVLRHE